ncbi:4Fe-4S binding protein [Candidatus Electronema sp. PJ]|uniref:4Fe-4S binding protein n=1 Tax=Candidatus Electronema sp. PJ TaxID=3401572 RepID=UPI003AA7DB6B
MRLARKWFQAICFFLVNGFWGFPFTGTIYQGPMKIICSPGLNCYSCPSSTAFCPIGALQQLLLNIRFSIQSGQYYFGGFVLGSIGMIGAVFGRFVCGWACPFGFFQELLYKLSSRKLSIPKLFNWLKYVIFFLLVILFPLIFVSKAGMGQPWFCKYVCPAGTFQAGIPMLILDPNLRGAIGWLFVNKLTIALGFTFWSVFSSRPFCRVACPLGAFYALFSRWQLIRLQLNEENCTECGACHKVCPVEIKFNETPNSGECVNCMKCMTEACAFDAIFVEVAGFPMFGPDLGKTNKCLLPRRKI